MSGRQKYLAASYFLVSRNHDDCLVVCLKKWSSDKNNSNYSFTNYSNNNNEADDRDTEITVHKNTNSESIPRTIQWISAWREHSMDITPPKTTLGLGKQALYGQHNQTSPPQLFDHNYLTDDDLSSTLTKPNLTYPILILNPKGHFNAIIQQHIIRWLHLSWMKRAHFIWVKWCSISRQCHNTS